MSSLYSRTHLLLITLRQALGSASPKYNLAITLYHMILISNYSGAWEPGNNSHVQQTTIPEA